MFRNFLFTGVGLLVFTSVSNAVSLVRRASGANPAAIQFAVDQFRADLGALNPNTAQTFTSGRREINWDGVPDNFADPNIFKPNFFNTNSPRGVVFNAIEPGSLAPFFLVSAKTGNATSTPLRFGGINPTYPTTFQAFSPERLFMMKNSTEMEVTFFVPGTKIPATVSGFGVVFADVDNDDLHNATIQFYGPDGLLIDTALAPEANNGLSFIGFSFLDGERIARVVIQSGKDPLSAQNTDGVNGADVTVMDDFIYGEPRAVEYHAGDYDGDGTADISVFRPSTGSWFLLNSGTNTVTVVSWGEQGDVPVDGDYDGDRRSDFTVFRPTTGQWFTLRSSDAQVNVTGWGIPGDKPLSGDFDKDGKTDIAVFRPSDGIHYVINSSTGQPQLTQWGANGDIPIMSAPNSQ